MDYFGNQSQAYAECMVARTPLRDTLNGVLQNFSYRRARIAVNFIWTGFFSSFLERQKPPLMRLLKFDFSTGMHQHVGDLSGNLDQVMLMVVVVMMG